MICLDDKLAELDTATTHLGRAFAILDNLGYTWIADQILPLLEEVGVEMGDIESELDEEL